MIQRKCSLRKWYEELLRGCSYVQLQHFRIGERPVWWVNTALLPAGFEAEQIGSSLMKARPDMEIRPAFYPLHLQKSFKHAAMECPNAEILYERLICLPSSPMLNRDDVKEVCHAVLATMATQSHATEKNYICSLKRV